MIPLDRPARLLQKARAYLADMDFFLSDGDPAITVLLDALPHADAQLIVKMLPLIGSAGKERVLWPLYSLVTGISVNDQVRRMAAMQLALAASLSDDPSVVQDRLIGKLNHDNPSIRSSSALALGWEGNRDAVDALMTHLQDPDREVQSAVVSALSSVGDFRVLNKLIGRLKNGSIEERRSIISNLWRFEDQIPRIESEYLACVAHCPPDLKMDAIAALAMIPLSSGIINAYRRLLKDADPKVRFQVIENLSGFNPSDYQPLSDNLRALLADADVQVRRAVVRLFGRR